MPATTRTCIAAAVLWLGAAHADPAYQDQIQKWREGREARLKADDGWLTVAGLFWLTDGTHRIGTGPKNEIVLPPGSAAPLVGTIEQRGGKTTITVQPGVPIESKGAPVTEMALRPDSSGEPDVLTLGRLSFFVIERGGRFGIRLRDKESPQRKTFAGLSWYPIDESYRIAARFVPNETAKTIPVPNILGQVLPMPSPGRAVFTIGGKEVGLDAVLEEPDDKQLFFIFADGTSGKGTYGAGRFLYTDLPKDGRVVLDFNKAYSPPCAFTPFATCPLPPKQNRLPVKIEAGEKH
jgi:uncharacterized protein